MSCYHPLKAYRVAGGVSFSELARHDNLGAIELPCGQCIGCRMRRASDWELRVMHEASQWDENCFVTLTYARDCLPPNASLEHRDFQLFMKRLRQYVKRQFARSTVRFYMCGEYGPLNQRPHYHACLFNVDFRSDRVLAGKSGSGFNFYESPTLTELWSHGKATVQDLTRETAGYTARYIMKKALGENADTAYQTITDDGEIVQRKAEYAAMSLRPGIGFNWFSKYGRDVFPHDLCVTDGQERRTPRYYDKLLKRSGSVVADQVEFERVKRAQLATADNTDERRAVREVVHLARVRELTRDLE